MSYSTIHHFDPVMILLVPEFTTDLERSVMIHLICMIPLDPDDLLGSRQLLIQMRFTSFTLDPEDLLVPDDPEVCLT
jgi:hypothetical protein